MTLALRSNAPKNLLTIDRPPYLFPLLSAGVAQLVEHHLAKVDVESSSLFARSIFVKRLKVTSGAFSCLNILTIGSCEIVNLAF